jgi:hypothetical protein
MPFVMMAQYQIKIKSIRTTDSVAYFRGAVFDDKNFLAKDTIPLYKGNFTIKYAKSIVGGVYYLYFPKSKQKIFFIIEDRDSIQLELRGANYLDSITTNLSKNKIFLDYQRLENRLSKIDSIYNVELQKGRKFSIAQKALYFKDKTDELTNFRQTALKKLKPFDALSVYFIALNLKDNQAPNAKDFEGRTNFLRQFNIANPKLLFTPIMKDLIFDYLTYFPKRADSICKGIDSIIAKVDCKSKAYPYVMDLFTKVLKSRNLPNNTEGYEYFIEKYIQKSKCKFLSLEAEKKVLAELEVIKALKLNDTCINILLPDTVGIVKNLHTISKEYDYTVIVFYDPLCEHCKVEVPKMDSSIHLLAKQLNKRIGVYAICNTPEISNIEWKKFIYDYQLINQYTHVKMSSNSLIRNAYDAYSNPVFFLIDGQSKMIAKKISPSTLRRILVTQIQLGK